MYTIAMENQTPFYTASKDPYTFCAIDLDFFQAVGFLTWIPIRIAFFGTLNPVESKALRKAVWMFGPKQAT